jgi:septal ring factor EnvC (AmiA/AmiB activator)
MKNCYLETERESLKETIESSNRRLIHLKSEMAQLEETIEYKEFILSKIEKELKDRGVNLEELDKANEW